MARAETAIARPHRLGFLATLRNDTWWLEPGLIAVGLSIFLGYLTISAFIDGWEYEIGPYLSPVFEPKLHGAYDAWYFSPALLILAIPVGFRATCYYYRRAYYRSYFLQPPACAVGDFQRKYSGESRFPLILQNLHRFFMYGALVFVPHPLVRRDPRLLQQPRSDRWQSGRDRDRHRTRLDRPVVNAFLLMMYTFSCHSFRHFVGGGLDCFSLSAFTRARKRLWDRVTVWNANHRLWAWSSLVWIVFTDLYIRLVANDVITDPNTWGF